MDSLQATNLIRIFDFYLAVMLLFGLIRRWQVYADTAALLFAVRGRWPKLMDRMADHKGLVLNWPTLRPAVLALGLMLAQMVASRLVWPQAKLRVGDVPGQWWQPVVLFLALVPMLAVDVYFLARVGVLDRAGTEKYLDQAEKWSGTRKARAIRILTLGRIDPDRLVDEGVRQGLTQIGQTVNWSMWWVSLQVALRMLFGLTVWTVWAVQPTP